MPEPIIVQTWMGLDGWLMTMTFVLIAIFIVQIIELYHVSKIKKLKEKQMNGGRKK